MSLARSTDSAALMGGDRGNADGASMVWLDQCKWCERRGWLGCGVHGTKQREGRVGLGWIGPRPREKEMGFSPKNFRWKFQIKT